MNRKSKIGFLQNLNEEGVEFSVFADYYRGGYIIISPEEVLKYAKDPELYRAKRAAQLAGISLRQWYAYEAFSSNPQCIAITRKGQQCKKMCRDFNASDFDPDIDRYCSYHSRLGGYRKWRDL